MTNLGSPKSTKEPARISGNVVIARISGETVLISGLVIVISSAVIQAEISGDWVNISGAYLASGQAVSVSGNWVDVSGATVTLSSGTTYLASGQVIGLASGAYLASGQPVNVSGNVVQLASGTTQLASGQYVTPTTLNDESVWLLRRIVKLLESGGITDIKQRQAVTIEAIGRVVATGAATECTTTIPVSTSVSGNTLIASVSGNVVTVSGNLLSIMVAASGQVNIFADFARTAYATGIRSNLSW